MFNFGTDKRGMILEGAISVFMIYGYKKTSMNDIADKAGVSRPALYQSFKNKSDIFRGISVDIGDYMIKTTKEAFEKPRSIRDQLISIVDKTILQPHKIAAESPHTHELFDLKHEIARDIDVDTKKRMIAAVTSGISQAAHNGKADLSALSAQGIDAHIIATIFINAMFGIRDDWKSHDLAKERLFMLIHFITATIAPKAKAAPAEQSSTQTVNSNN